MRTNLHPRFHFKFIYVFLLMLFTGSGLFAQTSDSQIFRDDFERPTFGSFWEAGDSWSIVNGIALNFIDGTGGSLRTATAFPQTSYIIETSAAGFTTNYYREFRVTFGQADLATQAMYQIRYTAYDGGRLTLSKSTDNIYSPQVLDEVAVYPALNSHQWYSFKIAKYKSGLIQVYMDQGLGYSSVPLLEAIDSTYPELGHTGWQVDTQSFAEAFYVDWISASQPGTEKPAVTEKPVADSLIVQVTANSGKPYQVNKLTPGVQQFIDRKYLITSVPDYLNGASFIQTANDDKANTDDAFLTFFAKAPAIIYIGYDPRSLVPPAWLNQFTKTPDHIEVSDNKVRYLDVYSRSVDFGEVYPYPVILGGNLAGRAVGSEANYLVAAVKRPDLKSLQAEDAVLSGALVASEHPNYDGTGYADFQHRSKDYVEWTVQIDVPGTYNLGFRFANGGLNYRSLLLTDNGVKQGTEDFSPTFSWDSWAFLSGPAIFLSAGTHKIRLTAIGDGGPNIDELNLFYLSPFAPLALARNHLPAGKTLPPLAGMSYKAYPNPFTQSTKIYYGLKEKATVNLAVYTLQGQLIQVLENRLRDAGNYESTFNSDKLAKGTYIIRLQIGDEIKSGKLIKE